MASVKRTIEVLYIETKTANTAQDTKYLDAPEIILIVDTLYASRIKHDGSKRLTKKEISDIINFLLRLTDTPIKKRSSNHSLQVVGVLALKPSTLYLLEKAFEHLLIIMKVDKSVVMAVAEMFYNILETASQPKDLTRYLAKPHNNQSLLARFHYDAYQYSLRKDGSHPLYTAYGYMLHKRIKFNSNQGLGIKTVEDYIRSARFFFKYMPQHIKDENTHDPHISDDYIDLFVTEYNQQETKSALPLTDDAIKYKKTFNRLIERWEGKPSPRLGRIPYDELDWLDGEAQITDREDFSYQNAAIIMDEHDPRRQEEPYSDIDLGYIKRKPGEDLVTQKPRLTRKWTDLVNLRSFHYPWDVKHLNLFHYAILYEAIGCVYGYNPRYRAVAIYLLILIHTGIEYKKLLSLTAFRRAEDSNKHLTLRKIHGRYYISYPSFVFRKDTVQNKHCHDVSAIVHIPLPADIMRLFDKVPTKGNIFIVKSDDDGPGRTMTIGDVKSFLRKYVNKYKAYKRFSLRITLSKISSSFSTLYSDRCSLDKLLSMYISGHDYHRLYSSQAHYIHIPHEKLEHAYLLAFSRANKIIFDNYYECLKLELLPGYRAEVGEVEFMKEFKNFINTKQAPGSTLKGYGSSIIVKDDYIVNTMRALSNRINQITNPIDKHNLYTCYTYFALQFSTSMRPRNNPGLTWENFNRSMGTIVIRDKASTKFHEVRSVPLTGCLILLLTNLHAGFDKLCRFIALHHYPSILSAEQSDIFFLVSGSGRIVPFDLDNFATIVSSVVPDFDLPHNMPRHYLRNFLYHTGFSHDLVDTLFGHQHNGKELLNVISSTIPSQIGKLVLPAIDKMLVKLGIGVVKYV